MKVFLRRNIGIALCILFYLCFIAVARTAGADLSAAEWYLFSSVQRIVFGVAALAVFVKVFHKESWKQVINFKHFKDGMCAGIGLLVFTTVIAAKNAAGFGSLAHTSFATMFFCLFCQQVTTGFWEELNFRAFVLEGYFGREKRSRGLRLAYAGVSFFIFGMIHALEYDDIGDAAYIFLITGIYGFVFASVYLYSGNLLVPMLLHFIYDVAVNFQNFVENWNLESRLFHVLNHYVTTAVFIALLIAAFVFVLKKPAYEH